MKIRSKEELEKRKLERDDERQRWRAGLTPRARDAYDKIYEMREVAVKLITQKNRALQIKENLEGNLGEDYGSISERVKCTRKYEESTKDYEELHERVESLKEEVRLIEVDCNRTMFEEGIKHFSSANQEIARAAYERRDQEFHALDNPFANPSSNAMSRIVEALVTVSGFAEERGDKNTATVLASEIERTKKTMKTRREVELSYRSKVTEIQDMYLQDIKELDDSDHIKSLCPCCSYRTLDEPGVHDICPVCFWEDDGQSDEDADEATGGPNGDLSLTQARENYCSIKACREEHVNHVRDPSGNEV